jgi:serine/threonine protein kinase
MGIQHRDISPPNMMYRKTNDGIRGYLIDFDLASLVGRDSHNLDRTGTLPFMALELLRSMAKAQTPVVHVYAHDGEAVCWVILWLGVQYKDGARVRPSFEDWEMIDATTCYQEKRYILENLHLHPFTEPNNLLQEPIRGLLDRLDTYIFEKRKTRGKVPVPDIDRWIDECDKEIRAQASCIS